MIKRLGFFPDQILFKPDKLIPEECRANDGWYEEDCRWSIPFIVFEEKLLEFNAIDSTLHKAINTKEHWRCLKQWYPQFAEILSEIKKVE